MSILQRVRGSVTVAVSLAFTAPAFALDLVDPALRVSIFSSEPTFSVVVPGPSAPSYTSFIYANARNVSPRINILIEFDESGGEVFRGTLPLDGFALQMGRNAFANRLFASEFALPPPDFADGTFEITPDRTVLPVWDFGGGNPDTHSVAFAPGGASAFGNSMYAANPTAGSAVPAYNNSIVRVGTNGAVLGTLVNHPDGPYYLAFPQSAAYGDYLYFTLNRSSSVMRVNAAGVIETFATFAAEETPIDLAFGEGGALGDALYVTVQHTAGFASRRLVRLLPNGTVETVGTGLRGFRFDIDPASGDLFLADEAGGIVRVSGVMQPSVVGFSAPIFEVGEQYGSVEVTVRRTGTDVTPASVDYATRSGPGTNAALPGGDYLDVAGTLSFTAAEQDQTITIQIIDNVTPEPTREFFVELSNAVGAALGRELTSVLIADDDSGYDVELTAADPSTAAQGNNAYRITYRFLIVARHPGSTPPRVVQLVYSEDVLDFDGAQTTLLGAGAFGSYDSRFDQWLVPSLLPGQAAELLLTLTHTVQNGTGRFVDVAASVLDNALDRDRSNDEVTVSAPVAGDDLRVAVTTTTPQPVDPYELIVYDVRVSRATLATSPPVYADDVTLVLDLLSEGDGPQLNTVFREERTTGATCSVSNQGRRLVCPLGDTSPAGRPLPIDVRVEASGESGRTLRLTATVESPTFDPDLSNNSNLLVAPVAAANAAIGTQPWHVNCPSELEGLDNCGLGEALFEETYGICLFSSLAAGTWLEPQLAAVRAFRDRILLRSAPGRALVGWYYRVSPAIVRWIGARGWAVATARSLLAPVIMFIAYPTASFSLLGSSLAAFLRLRFLRRRGIGAQR